MERHPPMTATLVIRSHEAACIVVNALREHLDSFPYFQPPLGADQQRAVSECTRLLREAQDTERKFAESYHP
jgi:hypothetical protein